MIKLPIVAAGGGGTAVLVRLAAAEDDPGLGVNVEVDVAAAGAAVVFTEEGVNIIRPLSYRSERKNKTNIGHESCVFYRCL